MEAKQSFDLAEIDTVKAAEAGFELVLRHPGTDVELPGRIRLIGADSESYREKAKAFLRARAARLNQSRKLRVSLEELEAEGIELLVTATQGWSGITKDGAEFAYSPANARWLYQSHGWIREQVDAAVGDRANFLPRSASA